MMRERSPSDRQSLRALWSTWVLATLAALLLAGFIFVSEREHRLIEAEQRLQTEMAYLGHLLETALARGNFEQARQQVEAWGRLNGAIRFAQLVTDNGFSLAEFRRELPDARVLADSRAVPFSYREAATLRVEKSVESAHDAIAVLGWQLAGALLVIELIVFALLHQFTRYRRQVRLTEDAYKQRLAAQQALERMAKLDALTGLPNRYMLDQQLALRVAETQRFQRRLALLFVDIDNFKTVNDSFGHEVGDSLLRILADRMRTCLRGYDLLARFGGDEFVIVLANVDDLAHVESVASKITQTLAPRIPIAEREIFVSASIGISLFPDDADSPSDLLRKADAAMYTAKEAGRNCHRFYTEAMNASLARRNEIESGLHDALDRDELTLVYQPQVDIASGAICGCEALLRWRRDGQDIAPEEFVPLAEQSGLMRRLQGHVVDAVARQRAEWLRQGIDDLRIDINISGGRLAIEDLCQQLGDAIERHALAHRHLGIELTEHTLIETPETLIADLQRLHDQGLTIALDDFGTGFSSLAYLKTLPVDTLKIDRVFVEGLPDNRADNAIVRAVANIGREMGMRTLAEGIETEAQLECVRAAGCQMAQGFLLHRPMSADEIARLVSGTTAAAHDQPGPQRGG
jgi:diguanylate cyclase (GGDEF)-like protein